MFDAVAALGARRFDVVYTGHGALCWLPDLDRWAEVVDQLLRPGGRLYLAEMHPLTDILADEETTFETDYFSNRKGSRWTGPGSYATREATEHDENWAWVHNLGEVVTAVASRGLRVERLTEREITLFQRFPFLEETGHRVFRMPAGRPRIPLTYSLLATKRAPKGSGR